MKQYISFETRNTLRENRIRNPIHNSVPYTFYCTTDLYSQLSRYVCRIVIALTSMPSGRALTQLRKSVSKKIHVIFRAPEVRG
jgi:hypothetical protein